MDRVDKKVIIDAYRGGDDIGSNINGITEKNYNLELSKYIYDRLRSLKIPTTLTRDSDETLNMDNRVNRITSTYGKGRDVIVISNALTTGGENAEIVYALRNSSTLAKKIADELNSAGIKVEKYYQRRLPSDTALDYNQLIRDTKNNESIIIYYGNIDNEKEATFLKNNLNEIGEAIVIAITSYLNIPYTPINSNYYIVKSGDSLYSVAKKYNTTINELKQLNNLKSNNLSINQVLKIPTNSEEFNKYITYTVQKGDNLYSISKKYNTTIEKIKNINNLTNNALSIGQVLKIPSSSKEESTTVTNYIVKSGDSLYSIAKKYNTSVDKIKQLNNLNSNLLSIGQTLKIPNSNNTTDLTYKVVSGDSLYSIAKKYNTTVNKIKTNNNLNSNLLSIGQILKIPKE